jgi:hypothetical protein
MEVRLFSNPSRPGVGWKPRRESLRPLLPQHARNDTEFRYVLQPGEGIPGAYNMPIGQVFFVPREEITMRDCTEEELEAIRKSKEEFFREKHAQKISTLHGLQYSPHYLRQSRSQKPPSQ